MQAQEGASIGRNGGLALPKDLKKLTLSQGRPFSYVVCLRSAGWSGLLAKFSHQKSMDPAGDNMATRFRGSYSYKNQNQYARAVEDTLFLVIDPGDNNLAVMRFDRRLEGANSQAVDIPANYHLLDAHTQQPVLRIQQQWVITWVGDYDLNRDGDGVILRIFNQKQQAIQPV